MSRAGAAVTLTALPLTAVYVLHATPGRMALLVLAAMLPDVLVGLIAGAWIDRVRRTPILVCADIGRFALLSSIPIAAWMHALSFGQLWTVAFASGVLSVFFGIAAVAILPSLVGPDKLVEANSKLQLTDSTVNLLGSSSGGALIGLVGAPAAIIADAASYLISAAFLQGVSRREPTPERPRQQRMTSEIKDGISALWHDGLLRVLAFSDATATCAEMVQAAVFMLFLVHVVQLTPALIGVALAAGGIGTVVGAGVSARVTDKLGIAVVTIGGRIVLTLGWVALPGATLIATPLPVLLGAQFCVGLGWGLSGVNHTSITQAVTPSHLLGRVTAGRRWLIFAMSAAGAGIGGLAGTTVGITQTLVLSAGLSIASPVGLWLSPVRRMRTLPG